MLVSFAIGAVLSQGSIGKDLPIAYASRTLFQAICQSLTQPLNVNSSMVWFVKHFRPYLFGRKFKLINDHRPITCLFSMKDPGSRLARWHLILEEYDYEIIYKPGKTNKTQMTYHRLKSIHYRMCLLTPLNVFLTNITNLKDINANEQTNDTN